jgi:uncharacterized protein YbjT (DUF2867 family)
MKLIITGSLGNIGKPLTKTLVAAKHDVTVISSQADRRREIESLGAKAAIGSIGDEEFLASTFASSDAVFAMTPPGLGRSNVIAITTNAGKSYAKAFQKAGVKRVVMLSSIGAHLSGGNGPIAAIHNIEHIYSALPDISFTFLRAGYFYTNFLADIPMIKNAGIEGSNFPASTKMPLVHPEDIASVAAEELLRTPAGNTIRYVVGDVRTGTDIAKVLGEAIGKPELPWVEFTDEQAIQGMTQAGLSEEIASLYAEMGAGFRNGSVSQHFVSEGSPVSGKIKLETFAKQFASNF